MEEQNTEVKPIMFNNYGSEINANDIIKIADSNVDRYIEYKGWNKKKRDAFMQTYQAIISDISSGKINARSAGKKWTGTSTNLQNIDKGFDSVGEVLHFLDPIVDKQNSKPVTKEQFAPSAFRKYFNEQMFGGVDPSQAQWDAWRNLDIDDKDGNRQKIQRAKKLSELIGGYIEHVKKKKYDFTNTAFGDENTYISRLQHAQSILKDDTFNDDDIRAFNQLGIDISNFLSDSVKGSQVDIENKAAAEAQRKAEEEEEKRKAEAEANDPQRIQEKQERLRKEQENELVNHLQKTYGDKNNFQSYEATIWNRGTSFNPSAGYNRDSVIEEIGKDLSQNGYSKNRNKVYYNLTRFQILEDAFRNGSNSFWENGDGSYYIKHSWNTNDNSGWVVKMNSDGTIVLSKKRLSQIPAFRHWAQKKYAEGKITNTSIWARKNGGILKAANGATMPELNPEEIQYLYQYYQASQQPTTPQKVPTYFEQLAARELPWESMEQSKPLTSQDIKAMQKERDEIAKSKGYKNEKQQKEYQRKLGSPISEYKWKGEDWAELGAIGADIVSLVSAWIPGYGTAVSAVTGAGATLTRFGADISRDGLDWGDVGRAVWGLGADVAGLIPGLGSGAKAGKIVKSIVKYVPWLMSIASTTITGTAALPALKKLSTDEKLTVEDWKNLGNLLVAVVGTSNTAASSLKTKAMMNQAKTAGETRPASILTKDGREVTLTSEQLSSIRNAQGLEGKNAALRAITGNAADEVQTTSKFIGFGTKFNESSLIDAQTIPGYDFSKLDSRWWRGGNWSDAALLQSRMNWNMPGFRNPYNRLGVQTVTTPQTSITPTTAPTTQVTPTSFTQWQIGPKGHLFPKYASRLPMVQRANGTVRITPEQAQQWNLNNFHAGYLTGAGKAYWWKEGGKVPFLQGGGKPNVQRGKNYKYPAKELATLTIARLLSGNETPEQFNTQQHIHSEFRDKYDKNRTGIFTFTEVNPQVQQYQGWFNTSGYNTPIWDNYSMFNRERPTIVGAKTNDKKEGYNPDGMFEAITDTRHRGRKEDYEGEEGKKILDEVTKMYNDAGYEYYLDPSDNYYKLRLKKPSADTPSESTSLKDSPDEVIEEHSATGRTDESDKKRREKVNKIFDKVRGYIPEALPIAGLVDSINHNNKVYDILKNSMNPLLTDTYTLNHPIYGNLAARNFHEKEAAKITDYTTHARTSDARLNQLTALEGMRSAADEREKGFDKDNVRIEETRKDALSVQDENTKRHLENANANRARLTDFNAAIGQLLAQREASNYNSRDQFRKELYNKYKTQRDKENAFYDQYYLAMAPKPEDDPVVKASAVKWTQNQTPENYEEYQVAIQRAQKNYYENYFKQMAQRYGYSIPTVQTTTDGEFNYTFKSGGALDEKKLLHKKRNDKRRNDIKDNELFHKNARHSKSQHDKNMRNTTNGIQDLFKRSTDLKRK